MKFTRTWQVGDFTATLSVSSRLHRGAAQIVAIEWEPDVPDFDTLPAEAKAQYQAGLQDAMLALAATIK